MSFVNITNDITPIFAIQKPEASSRRWNISTYVSIKVNRFFKSTLKWCSRFLLAASLPTFSSHLTLLNNKTKCNLSGRPFITPQDVALHLPS